MAPNTPSARYEAIKIGYNPFIILERNYVVHQLPKRIAEPTINPHFNAWLHRESGLDLKYEKSVCNQLKYVAWVAQEDLEKIDFLRGRVRHTYPVTQIIKQQSRAHYSVVPNWIDQGGIPIKFRFPKNQGIYS